MAKELTHSDVFKIMEEWASSSLAYDWDNVGLQIGSGMRPVKKIMITLDVVESVVNEAIENEVDLIIAHHPMLFKPLSQINLDAYQGQLIEKLMIHHITVYAAHTNLDIADGGVNDLLFDALNLHSKEVFIEEFHEELFKIAVFVPGTHKEKVLDALRDAGAGHIGNYSDCTFQTVGHGTFKPLEGTNPYLGSQNKLEIVDETKIETIVPKTYLSKAIHAMIQAHPYEEVAYDIYPLEQTGNAQGLGRIGHLKDKITLKELVQRVKEAYHVPNVRVTGDLTKEVTRIAILGGSGEKYFTKAIDKGVDVYITGDMTFHAAQDAEKMGLSIIDPGHHIEKIMKKGVKEHLKCQLQDQKIDIMTSTQEVDPFKFI